MENLKVPYDLRGDAISIQQVTKTGMVKVTIMSDTEIHKHLLRSSHDMVTLIQILMLLGPSASLNHHDITSVPNFRGLPRRMALPLNVY